MKINLREISIREITDGYENNDENGVKGYKGKLNIRPEYQREFVYKDKQRDEVVHTVQHDLPLNVMYWSKNVDGTFEVLDGQQRTISICEYIIGSFSIEFKYFHNLSEEEQKQLLDYKLMVYVCEGNQVEKLEWFKTINIAGEKLTAQELRNAIYTGEWLSDAKRYFSRPNSAAYNLAHTYLKGSAIRQDYLETAIGWISEGNIDQYMANHQHEPNANALWLHFQNIISWIKVIFPTYRKEMKGIDYGMLYRNYGAVPQNSGLLEIEIIALMKDEDVTKKSGIYYYVLTRNEKWLNIRTFTPNQKREAYEKQQGICIKCNNHFGLDDMEADHITPWYQGGKTSADNCQMLCKHCNRIKAGK